MNWALEQRTGDVRRKAVLLALADISNSGGYCEPEQKKLADWSEQSRRTVQRCLIELEQQGKIRTVPRFDPVRGDRLANGYQLMLPGVTLELLSVALLRQDPPSPLGQGVRASRSMEDAPQETRPPTSNGRSEVQKPLQPRVETTSSPTPPHAVENAGRFREEVVDDVWKRVKATIYREWHQGDEVVVIDGVSVGMGLERLRVGELVQFHGPEATELAIRAAARVPDWSGGWPRTLAWFTSEKHGGENFQVATHLARRQRRGTGSEMRRIGQLLREADEMQRTEDSTAPDLAHVNGTRGFTA